ncbi:DegT/DnrJ/EryC1/StrS family aminotransferase [Massilia sp. H6]|uniref:DegT/DnrJ/EryC1/StrS family aminotransferase n=1 Tax=Massilia sp. H6 TaxID=2970464 RepID=UPI002167AAD9|nr:DegT/DnrJ/EryC1/StrS family aminotransferase [Massilia sp. H6]UVW27861.1 DegT/DnrJ/EryC1/StrS family aminotransferase [Massilia sp. H6]
MYAGVDSAAPERLPVSNRVARQVICLPIYSTLDPAQVARMADVIRTSAMI